jgi:SPX domain protein involved in polyphosphate accumulation
LGTIGKSPGEIAFFKLLHAEFKKATHFFDRAQQEYVIREERVRKGMEIMKQPNSIMVGEKWSLLAKSIYRLYKDLLLLETFAIMTYCGFSKILKKHVSFLPVSGVLEYRSRALRALWSLLLVADLCRTLC